MDISKYRRRHRRYEVNIVPLVDVLTVLIFFFLITMQFKQIRVVEITPPSMSTSQEASIKNKPEVIGVDKDGNFYFGDKKVSLQELEDELARLKSKNENCAVVLVGDKTASYEAVTQAIDKVRKAKIKKMSLQTLSGS